MKLADSLNPATQAENIKKLNAGLEAVDAKTLPGTSTATTGQILKLTGENKTPAWADEYSYTPPAYSNTEVNTGQKWIDGSDIFCIAYFGTLPIISSSTFYNLLNIGMNKRVIEAHLFCDQPDLIVETAAQYLKSTGYMRAYLTSASSEQEYSIIAYYTKLSAPETRDDDTPEEVKETKTRKKTTK